MLKVFQNPALSLTQARAVDFTFKKIFNSCIFEIRISFSGSVGGTEVGHFSD